MLITKIELENIKSYRKVSVTFRQGTTAISGANGAGKTTLVEAVGFALFGYLPYNQEKFVREGEKQGRVVIYLIGSDDRPYEVERRCGSGSRWTVYDIEANSRLEQRADVLDKLHELFGIERERPLDSLFRDALGVPQGTFTAIFLEAASKRKQTFDALLQIEDYKTAADYLLDAQKQYKEQMGEQTLKIKQLEYETAVLETFQIQLQEARQRDQEQKQLNAQDASQLAQNKIREQVLTQQSNELQVLRHRYEQAQLQDENAQKLLTAAEGQLGTARNAHQIVTTNLTAYQRYQQAEEMLQRLRKAEQQRAELLRQQSILQKNEARSQTQITHLQERLAEVATARARLSELAPFVQQQIELERRREELLQQVERYKATVSEEKKLSIRVANFRRDQEQLQRRISDIEPLVPLANQLPELSSQLTELKVQRNERKNKVLQLQEKKGDYDKKQKERDQLADKLRKAEHSIEVIEEHRKEAEELSGLQTNLEQLAAQQHRLEGNIEGYARSRAQSAGGQCPLLHESCLNIKHRGIVSLESYFEGLLTEEQANLAEIANQQGQIHERIGQIKRYAEALSKLEQFIERRDMAAEQLTRTAKDLTRLERDINDLTESLAQLQQVDRRFQEIEIAHQKSLEADKQVRELAGLYKQVQQFEEQIQQGEKNLQDFRQIAESLQESEKRLGEVDTERAKLNDPRGQSQAQQSIIAGEPRHLQQLQEEQEKAAKILQGLQGLQKQLMEFASLDGDIERQEEERKGNYGGYQLYLQHQKEAQRLPERELAYQSNLQAQKQTGQNLQIAEQGYREADAAFDPALLEEVHQRVQGLERSLATLAQQMKQNQELMNGLEQQIVQAEALLLELKAAQQEYSKLEDLYTMMEQFRKLIKEAAPHVLKAMLGDISAEANRIFGEIMGDRTAMLAWQNDYEITLRRQGVNRTFAQLSGGEQMSAALAVRLALLKKLSTLNIAFFDEPTQNMDELRRMNLADQIRRVRGFDQLIVISHDDTFEQGLDSLVRLNKVHGETFLQEEDGQMEQAWNIQHPAETSTIPTRF